MSGTVPVAGGQLALDLGPLGPDAEERDLKVRRYWEHRGPGRWEAVRVRVRYGDVSGDPVAKAAFPEVRTARLGPRNVLVEREDGTVDVRPVRQLRVRRPG